MPSVSPSITLALLALFMGFGCGDCPKVDRNIEPLVTVDRGVYGQLTTYNDIAGECAENPYLEGKRLGVFVGRLSFTEAQKQQPAEQVTAGGRGFFELELDHGPYTICPGGLSGSAFVVNMNCTSVALDATTPLLRLDFGAGPGGGIWHGGDPVGF